CVPYARDHSGVRLWGDATTWWGQARGRFSRSSDPEPGSVMVIRGYDNDERGHLAVVRRVLNDREIVVDHANWLNGGEISLDNPNMDVPGDNDWSEVRFWYEPGHHYGGRVYQVQGFILGYAASAPCSLCDLDPTVRPPTAAARSTSRGCLRARARHIAKKVNGNESLS